MILFGPGSICLDGDEPPLLLPLLKVTAVSKPENIVTLRWDVSIVHT
jgi:hypothetical protein